MTKITMIARRLALVFMLVAAGAAATASAAPLPEIRYADGAGTATSMPGNRARNTSTDNILLHVVESLVALRADMSVGPMLADSWAVSRDARTYTFKLRPGATFHNGAPVTSAEVKWSYNFLMNPKSEWMCRNLYDGAKGPKVIAVDTPTPDTVVFRLEEPYALFLDQMASVQCPLAVLHPSSVDAQGAWLKPVATGPYLFSDWKKGQSVLLTRFDGYKPRPEPLDGMVGNKQALANLRFVVIPDAAAQKAALMAGQVDIINADEDNLPPKDPRWNVVVEQGLDTVNLLMQGTDPLLKDVRMRRAIALALDLPAITKALNNGLTQYNPSLVPAASRYYSAAERRGYARNLAEAKTLMDAAGYKAEVIKIQANKRYPYMYRLAVVTQSLLSKAGIKTELEMLEWATQVSNFREGKFQLMAFGYSARTEPALLYRDVLGNKSKTPMAQWENPEALTLLDSIEGNPDEAVRRQTFEKLHDMMIADVPMAMVYNKPGMVVVSRNVTGFKGWPLRKPRLFNLTKH